MFSVVCLAARWAEIAGLRSARAVGMLLQPAGAILAVNRLLLLSSRLSWRL